MASVESDSVVVSQSHPVAKRRSSVRWWWAVFAGLVVSVPLGWLLSYGAALVALLGIFFFTLFGLVIGAVMYRFGAPARPIPKSQVSLGAAVVVAFCWCLAMTIEVHEFPTDRANAALRQVSPLPDGVTGVQFKQDVADFVRDTFAQKYGGFGFFGYARWILASSRMEYPVETMTSPIVIKSIQYRWWWIIRVVLTVVMLSFGILAQVLPLARPPDHVAVSNDAPRPVEE